jgi:hypothetical protein
VQLDQILVVAAVVRVMACVVMAVDAVLKGEFVCFRDTRDNQ